MRKIFWCCFTLPFLHTFAMAQGGSGVKEEEINVVKPYKPVLSDAVKLNDMPAADSLREEIPALEYKISPRKINTIPEITPIKPLRLKDETIPKLYRNFARLGFGNYTTAYGELFVNSLWSKDRHLGLHLNHLSSSGKIPGVGFSGYSTNEAEVYGKKLVKNEWLAGELDFSRNVVHFYGFNSEDTVIERADIRQRYNYLGTSLAAYSNSADSNKLSHKVKAGYYNLSDIYSQNEDHAQLEASAGRKISAGFLKIDGSLSYTNNKQSLAANIDRTVIGIRPALLRRLDVWELSAGVNTVIEAGGISGFHLYPHLGAEIRLAEENLIAFSSLGGGIAKNTLKSFTDENPFISPVQEYRNSNNRLDFSAGLKGTYTEGGTFNAFVNYREVKEMPFFVRDTSSDAENSFVAVYDNARLLNIHAETGYRFLEKWNIVLSLNFYNYKMSAEMHPWHKPAYDVTFTSVYNIGRKIYLRGDIFIVSQRYSKTFIPADPALKLNGYADANLGIDYRYSKAFSVFFNFNNIAAQRYYSWDRYPSQRFNMMAGLSYGF
jgi:hypothetical protein